MQEEVSAKERKTEQRLGEMCTVAEESEGSQTREQSQRRWLAVLVREKASGLECLCRSCCLAAIFFLLDLHLEARSFLLVQLPLPQKQHSNPPFAKPVVAQIVHTSPRKVEVVAYFDYQLSLCSAACTHWQ